MNRIALFTVVLGALAFGGTANAAEVQPTVVEAGQITSDGTDQDCRRRRRPREAELSVSTSGRRIGGYSYSKQNSVSTYHSTPPPYLGVKQSPGGPFDSGFFYDSGIPRGDNSPYPR